MKPVLANELRIGNIISQGEIDLLEVRRGENDDSLFVRVNGSGIENPTAEPLTEEWLLKFGFADVGNKDFLISPPKNHLSINFKAGIGSHFGKFAWSNVVLSEVEVKYAHQLQNLYYALTGTELTYNTNQSK